MNVLWNEGYSPAQASRGSWVVLDPVDLTTAGYPTSAGSGKYAELVYLVGGGSITVSTSGSSTIAITIPNTQISYSGTYTTSATTITLPTNTTKIEVYNKTGSTYAYMMMGTVNYNTLTAQGIPIAGSDYYNLQDVSIASVTIGTEPAAADLRIMAYYKV